MRIKWRLLQALVVLVGLAFGLCVGNAGNQETREITLFNGSTPNDTTAKQSPWFSVRGANRVLIRTWTASTASYTALDSVYSDSIGVFQVLLSDSVSFIGRDSAGSIVTVGSYTSQSDRATSFPVCADSVVITGIRGTARDTTYKMVNVFKAPIEMPLRAAAGGSGVYTIITPALPPNGDAIHGDGTIPAQYMKIRYTPYQRLTLATAHLTAGGIRTQGLRGLRMRALVSYQNK